MSLSLIIKLIAQQVQLALQGGSPIGRMLSVQALWHWARDCTEIVCGNCKQRGHYAADCPDPAPCFHCGQLGHWAKDCPQLHADQLANTETRWIIFEPLTLKIYRHSCAMCGYETSVVTKASGGMPRHKCNGEWCNGSGLHPGCSELLEECNQNRKEYLRTLTCFHLDLDSKAHFVTI